MAATRRYSLYGLVLEADAPFVSRVDEAAGEPPDLAYSCFLEPPPVRAERLPPPLYSSPWRLDTGESVLSVHRLPRADVLRFPGVADFHLERRRVTAWAGAHGDRDAAELCLLGAVLAIWLERRSVLALHASAVITDRGTVAFLSSSRGGKSTLAAAFVKAGHALLCDDILPVERPAGEWTARPGYAQLRLWPDTAAYLDDDWRRFERIHPAYEKRRVPVGRDGIGSWCRSRQPLAAVYVPGEATSGEAERTVRIEPLPRRHGLMELVRHSFAARAVEAMGLQPDRLDRLGDLARRVPLRRLEFGWGMSELGRVREAILRDLEGRT